MSRMSRRHVVSLAATLPFLSGGAAQAAKHGVTIPGMAISPASFEGAAGDTIILINADSTPPSAEDGAFDTGRINPGQNVEVATPDGSHRYVCIAPTMTGVAAAR